jgi:hypothetical protein
MQKYEPYLKRRVRRDEVGRTVVSTVLLGDVVVDFGDYGVAAVETWETKVFGDESPMNGYTKRYTSIEDALEGHETILKRVKRRGVIPKRVFLEDNDSVS